MVRDGAARDAGRYSICLVNSPPLIPERQSQCVGDLARRGDPACGASLGEGQCEAARDAARTPPIVPGCLADTDAPTMPRQTNITLWNRKIFLQTIELVW
jgi:hypothetical protein